MQMIATPKEKQMAKLPAKEMEIVGQWTKSDLKKKNYYFGSPRRKIVKLFIVKFLFDKW